MRISKLVSVVVFAGLAIAAASASADPAPTPPTISCKPASSPRLPRAAGASTAQHRGNGIKPPARASFKNCDKDNHCDSASFTGKACSGTVTAYVCTGSSCAPPMKVAVTGS